MKSVEITVSPTGETSVQTKGFSGADCFAASEFIEKSLGKQLKHRKSAEFFSTINAVNKQETAREST